MGDWIARGTYPVAIGVADDERARQVAAGFKVAPLQMGVPGAEAASCGSFLLGIMDQAPHPNAAKLFANWILTKEGQQALSDAESQAGVRTDLDTSKLNPVDVPGSNYSKLGHVCSWDYSSGLRVQLGKQVQALLAGH